jgi:hypothetical protein
VIAALESEYTAYSITMSQSSAQDMFGMEVVTSEDDLHPATEHTNSVALVKLGCDDTVADLVFTAANQSQAVAKKLGGDVFTNE